MSGRPAFGGAGLGRSAAYLAWLTILWVLLWGEVTLANVLGGVVVAGFLLWAFPRPSVATDATVVRPFAVLTTAGWFTWKLIEANVRVAVTTVQPRPRISAAIVAVPLPGCPAGLLTLVATGINLTPGTLVVDHDEATSTLYVHTMEFTTRAATVAEVHELERRVVAALGSTAARAAAAGRELPEEVEA